MKYLAFDIEAANGYMLSSVCSVGIVIADEQFNVLSRENILINPRTEYNLNGTRANVGIDLHLDKKLLKASPDFRHVYPRLKALLTDKQYLVVGHAVDCDVRMLNKACERYHLPSINFEFVCSQLLYKLYKGENDVKGLDKIAGEIGLTFTQHNSEEDAYASLMTLKYLVEQGGVGSVDELVEKYHVRRGSNEKFQLTRPVSLLGQISKKRVTQLAIDSIKQLAAAVPVTGSRYANKAFCLARSLELDSGEVLRSVITAIVSEGGRYTAKLLKGDYYVAWEKPIQADLMREKRVAELAEQGQLRIVSVEDILEGRL